ncbi:MAG: PsbP-related protein [Rhodospirillales bacterium]
MRFVSCRWAAFAAAGLIGSAVWSGFAAGAEPGMTEFRHPRQGFSVSYPQEWRLVAFKDGPEFQALADGGKGPEECNVNVTQAPGTDYLDRINQARMLNTIRAAIKDARFDEWRRQTLARRWGIYYIVTGTIPRQSYRQTTLGYQIVVGAKLYTLSCSAPAARFEQNRPVFEKILSTLAF